MDQALVRGLFLARHGMTASNALGRRLGTLDEPLSEHGRAQARGLADRARAAGIGVVWTSPQLRARETARLVAAALGVTERIEPDLREMALGAWEGLTEEEIAVRYPAELESWRTDPDGFRMAGHEPLPLVRARVIGALERIIRATPGALCVTHFAPIRLAYAHFTGLPVERSMAIRPDHCQLIRLRPVVGGWRLDDVA